MLETDGPAAQPEGRKDHSMLDQQGSRRPHKTGRDWASMSKAERAKVVIPQRNFDCSVDVEDYRIEVVPGKTLDDYFKECLTHMSASSS